MAVISAPGVASPAFNGPSWPSPSWRRYGAAAVIALVAATIGAHVLRSPGARRQDEPATVPAPAAPSFVEADLPPLFAFGADILEKSSRHRAYLATLDGDRLDGDRLDIATIGDPASEGALLRLVAATGAASEPNLSLFVVAAKQAADLDSSILRMEAPLTWSAPRGRVEWAAMTLLTPRASRDCLALRILGREPVGLSGIVCPNAAGAADVSTLACVVDQLVATSAGTAAGLPEIVGNRTGPLPPCRGLSG